ncbi:MAG: alpha-L-fucosidase [Carboxylicivirga sp.]|jgi:alpha-L-fucosidase|nr:alpha-L-fucosidase [Carboxylicivirga sp.]
MRIKLSLLLLGAVLMLNAQRTVKIEPTDTKQQIIEKAVTVLPTANQYAYKQQEFICFIHFGINTFTRMEWGNGKEDPKTFDLKNLDTDQWCQAAKAAGMKMMVFTAKHHDGFCLWNTRYTKHSISSSPYKNGQGDVLADLSKSCQKYGLKLGVYLSPADLYQIENKEGLYGNLSKYSDRVIPRPVEGRPFANKTTFTANVDDYNEYFMNQLFELLTEYGPIHEVWFDGAHPKRKGGQKYNYLAWKELIHTLAPEAVIFGKEDVRWCGNESGGTRESEWDVIPFEQEPNIMNRFPDLHGDLGSREKLYSAKYLHYLPAETNTSIREGWFYRDDERQKVRSADDVFDMFERSVGGNSTFMLNIPPNRDGRFSDEDVSVLEEVGKRISKTYDNNLLANAKGNKELFDNNDQTYAEGNEFVIELASPVKVNRLVLQEPIHLKGMRIEKHALDAWVDNGWKEVAQATVIGYKRILRFPEVTTNKFRIRIEETRSTPMLCNVTAHYYESRPPQLSISRDIDGMVSILPKKKEFGWKLHGIDYSKNLMNGVEVRYTTDGSEPTASSPLYKKPFKLAYGEVKAKAFVDEKQGSTAAKEIGIIKKNWELKGDSDNKKHKVDFAADADVNTYWKSTEAKPFIIIKLNETDKIKGMVYTPHARDKKGLIETGRILISKDGKKWKELSEFKFGNLINDPTPRTVYFDKPVKTQYVKVELIRGAADSKIAAIAEIDFLK